MARSLVHGIRDGNGADEEPTVVGAEEKRVRKEARSLVGASAANRSGYAVGQGLSTVLCAGHSRMDRASPNTLNLGLDELSHAQLHPIGNARNGGLRTTLRLRGHAHRRGDTGVPGRRIKYRR